MSVDPKLMLLQARRADDPMKGEELRSFATRMCLDESRIVSHDLLEGPPTPSRAREFDALLMGGSGDFLVSRGDLPGFRSLLGFLQEMVDSGRPMFASCFGFQCLVEAIGGEIVHDPEAVEVGTFELTLTPGGAADCLLGELPPRFHAQMGRKDRARRLPDGFVNLATSERCPYQAFRVPGRPIWATQFHPELNADENKARFRNYMSKYKAVMAPEEQKAALDRFRESPETSGILRRFLEVVFA